MGVCRGKGGGEEEKGRKCMRMILLTEVEERIGKDRDTLNLR